MSSTSTATSDVTSSPSSSPSPTQNNNNNNNNVQSQPAFYRNLFYILIGLLAVFAIVSIFSLYRTRRRRSLIRREADRLGVLVPGLPGYIPLRERQSSRWTHADGTITPDWWDVGAMRWMKNWARPAMSRGYSGYSNTTSKGMSGLEFSSIQPSSFNEKPKPAHEEIIDLSSSDRSASFHPLAIIPPQASAIAIEPIHSTVKQFPIHLAYRPSDLLPPPSIWDDPNSSKLEALGGEHVDLVTMIRMPEPEQTRRARDEEGEEDGLEVLREWAGVCLGVMRVDVAGQSGTGRRSEEDRKGVSRGKGREI